MAPERYERYQFAVRRELKGQAYYDREIDQATRQIRGGVPFADPQMENTESLRGMELYEQEKEYRTRFDDYLQMDRRKRRRECGSREVTDALEGFTVEDPYEICFALFYLLDTGDDAPWLMGSGGSLMKFVQHMLPWYVNQDDWDTYYDGMPYNRNGWVDREAPPEQLDFFHDKHNGKNLAQVIYGLCRGVVPIGLHPFEEERMELVNEGMDEVKARKVTDIAEMLFLQAFQAKQYSSISPEWEEEEQEPVVEETPVAPVKLGGYWGRAAQEVIDQSGAAAPSSKLEEELEQAKKQIKSLRNALNAEKHTAEAERAKYERELKSLRMEHRELADLRSLVFNRENEVREEPVKDYKYPYETRKRTVIFGGHDTFLKAIKPMLPTVKFVDAGNLAFNPEIIRNADVVWIQNNCISHSQFWAIVKNCKQADVQMRYFGFASAEKCAEQLVTEDMK